MRIAMLLNNTFQMDNRVRREAEALVEAGHEVHLFAVEPGNSKLPQNETTGGIQVHRILRQQPKFKFINNRLPKNFNKVRKFGRFDAIHAHDAEMLALGWLLARWNRAKLVYDSHEYWQSLLDEKRKKTESKSLAPRQRKKELGEIDFAKRTEQWLLKRCDAVISVNDSICDLLKELANGREIPYVSLRNIPPFYETNGRPPRRFHERYHLPEQTKVLLFQGGMNRSRGIPVLLDIVEPLDDVVLILMGGFNPTEDLLQELFQRVSQSEQLRRRVIYQASVPPEELLDWTASADIGIHPIPNNCLNHYHCLPNKLFEYLQAGLPVAVSNMPEMVTVVEQHKIGFVFDPEHPASAIEDLKRFLSDETLQAQLRENVRKAKASLNWENEQKHLLSLYHELEKVYR